MKTKRIISLLLVLVLAFSLTAPAMAASSYPTLRKGSTGTYVKELQALLNEVMDADLTVDGIYGNATRRAVKAFQSKHGLSVDGVCGPKTWSKLLSLADDNANTALSWPLPGSTRITSYFKGRVHPLTGKVHKHSGIDISAEMGTAVQAAGAGVLYVKYNSCTHNYGKSTSCGCGSGYGNWVYILHDNGLRTIYAHLTSVSVASGTRVQQGQIIGTVGSTGSSSGYHLHFEVRTGSSTATRVDPLNYVTPK